MMRWGMVCGWASAAVLAGVPAAAVAADKPLYQPVPAWVTPAPSIDAGKLTDDSPIFLTIDKQERLADGSVWSYSDVATRLASPEVVTQAGTLTLGWQPDKGDLIIHRVEIIRGAERIDLLASGKRFEVLHREQQLEQSSVDGRLTATMAVEGLRVGDVLHLVASTTDRETALGGRMQADVGLVQAPARVGFVRARMLWPTGVDVHWKSYAAGPAAAVTTHDGMREVSMVGLLPKAADLPDDAPVRFNHLPLIEASSFADWASVSAVMAPLYATDGLIKPDAPLAAEVARIAAASADPLHRADAALQLVQERVRYLFNGLDNGNYLPQPPEKTWALRYGDCKAKTLLLLALLHALKIDAEPVLANSRLGDLLPDRLPSAGAFDHVMVRATIAGQTYWLDGTGRGTRYADLGDTPPLHWVLPVRAGGATLLAVPARAPADPDLKVVLELDQRAGITLPTLVHAVVTLHGPMAESIGLAKSQGSKEQNDQATGGLVGKLVGGEVALSHYTLAYDAAAAVATIDATGLVSTRWQRTDARYRMVLDRTVSNMTFEPDRARAAWRAIPVATGSPGAIDYHTRVLLPATVQGATLDGDATLSDTLGGATIRRTATIANCVVTIEEHVTSTGAEIAPGDVAAARTRVALAKQRLLTAVVPDTLPPRWTAAETGRRDGRFKPLLAVYAAAIADDPTAASGYVNRAGFQMGIFDWKAALPDLDRAIALEPTAATYQQRAVVHRILGEDAAAIADAEAARKLDPAFYGAIELLGEYDVDRGHKDVAIARVDERIDAGGDGKDGMIMLKAELLTRAGDRDAAIAALDTAIAAKPGNPGLLNARCWNKAELNTALDTALKDCTRAIELSDWTAPALDSRALVYLRMNRLDDALADVDAALDLSPSQASSLYLRGVIHSRKGDARAAAADLAGAHVLSPLLAAEYKHYGIVP